MQIEQRERESNLGQHILLDAALGANEEGLDPRICFHKSARDREPGIQVTPGAAPGEDHPHPAGIARRASGSVAASPNTLSRLLPMLTRMPVMRSERTRFERP